MLLHNLLAQIWCKTCEFQARTVALYFSQRYGMPEREQDWLAVLASLCQANVYQTVCVRCALAWLAMLVCVYVSAEERQFDGDCKYNLR